ncbi:MAG: SRPBCC family protein [Fimbriimonadaceae bacterium]
MNIPIFKITRIFNAPRDLVWECWTKAEHIGKWFKPSGFTDNPNFKGKFSFEVGDYNHYCMVAPDGTEIYGKYTFTEIDPKDKIVYINAFSDAEANLARHPMAPSWPLELLTTVTFTPDGDQTILNLTWEPINATQKELDTFATSLEGCAQGWGGTFENLDRYIGSL